MCAIPVMISKSGRGREREQREEREKIEKKERERKKGGEKRKMRVSKITDDGGMYSGDGIEKVRNKF